MLSGMFKVETSLKFFCQPLALQTEGGQDSGKSEGEGSSNGLLFLGHNGKHMSKAEMDLLFHTLLLDVQRRFTKVLPESVDVKKEFSKYWSFHQGLTSEAQNLGMPREMINANN